MKFQGAVISEQGVTFAIIVVKSTVFTTQQSLSNASSQFSNVFSGMPIILMCQDGRGIPKYYGRNDIVKFLSKIHISQIPWKEYEIN